MANEQVIQLERTMTNDEILAIDGIKEMLNDGKLVIIDMVETTNPEYTNIYFMGKVEGLASSNTEVSSLAAMLLGWDNSEIYMRSIQNASTDVAYQFEVGQAIPGAIQVVDSTEAFFDDQDPRIDRKGRLLLHNDENIYRTTKVCTAEELEEDGHLTLEVTEKVDMNETTQPKDFSEADEVEEDEEAAQSTKKPTKGRAGAGSNKKASVKDLLANKA